VYGKTISQHPNLGRHRTQQQREKEEEILNFGRNRKNGKNKEPIQTLFTSNTTEIKEASSEALCREAVLFLPLPPEGEPENVCKRFSLGGISITASLKLHSRGTMT